MKTDLKNIICEALSKSLKGKSSALHEPSFDIYELENLKECINSTFVSSSGKFIEKFEEKLRKYTRAKYVIPVVNGTSALHISLVAKEISQEDEVLLPAMTFVATANAVSYCGAIPHFVDSREEDLGIDTIKLREYLESTTKISGNKCINKKTGRRIKAIIPMHTFGHPSDLKNLIKIAKDFNLFIIEDAAEGLGSFYKEKHVGTIGAVGVLSFNGNKIITTGGGGAILTNNKKLAQKIKHISSTAKVNHKWEYIHDDVGYNYRMPNINAALGLAQLEKIDTLLKSKRALFKIYKENFKGIDEITLFEEPKNCKSNYWLQTLILDKNYNNDLEEILKHTNNKGFITRPVWNLLNELKPFKNCPTSNLENSISLRQRIINIPSSSFLSEI